MNHHLHLVNRQEQTIHRRLPELCILQQTPGTLPEPEVFWCTAVTCIVCKPHKPESVRDSTEKAGEKPAVSSGISMLWASFLREDRAGSTLSEMSGPKRLFVLSDSSQHRARSEQACSVVGRVWTLTECVWFGERLRVIVSAGVKRDSQDLLFIVYLFGCQSQWWEKVCVYWCVFVVGLRQRTDSGSG